LDLTTVYVTDTGITALKIQLSWQVHQAWESSVGPTQDILQARGLAVDAEGVLCDGYGNKRIVCLTRRQFITQFGGRF
jgi:hypothetical protein